MATVLIAAFNARQVAVELVLDELAVKRIQVTNNSDYPCAVAVQKANVLVREHIVNAHSEGGRNLPAGIAFANNLEEGEWTTSLGDIEIYCRWPA